MENRCPTATADSSTDNWSGSGVEVSEDCLAQIPGGSSVW